MDKIEERLCEIIKIAYKLKWITPNPKGYPLMQLSEVEKCMIAMLNEFELNRMREWYNEELRKDATHKNCEHEALEVIKKANKGDTILWNERKGEVRNLTKEQRGCGKEVKAFGDTFYCGQDIGVGERRIYLCANCDKCKENAPNQSPHNKETPERVQSVGTPRVEDCNIHTQINKEIEKDYKKIMCDNHRDRIATHVNENEPYLEEINNFIKKINYCDECWRDSLDEI